VAYPDDWPLEAVQTATCDASGAASVYFTVPAGEVWEVHRMGTYGTTSTKPGEVRVWRGGRGSLIASSIHAVSDVSENENLTLMPGEALRVEWAACDAGASMAFSVEGRVRAGV
jgi:hypothetical protein